MFNGFTPAAGEFLWELAFNNERPWFLEHKEQFEACVNEPFKALAADTKELMCSRFPEMDFRLHVSRIYRDARRLFGRGPYKDHMWFSFKHGSIAAEGPSLWFEIGPATYSYGLGFYSATPEHMAAFRRSIDANPARLERIVRKVERGGEFTLTGEEYKRPKGNAAPPLDRWYNRRRIALECCRDHDAALYSPELPEMLVDAFARLMPLYDYCLEFYHAADAEKGERL